ncbi:MAG: hypothetical protein Q8K93_04380 [Reyranella sp.]|uniref:hypothetical protein n=1 Tax=Reyranella sp. TaxID=1929291 RepID=UPI0027311833|nr:hypothetical protein [Reyranella sp.]MDP1961421.1 hypothetical protein [Reyranella sp.]MDP2373156.1 hypothetical protein [Reyranella sp.]
MLSQLATFSSRIGGEYFSEQVTRYIVVFAIGAAVAVAGTFMSYWTQFEWAKLEWADQIERDELSERRSYWLRVVAVSLGVISMVIFVFGVWLASCAIGR